MISRLQIHLLAVCSALLLPASVLGQAGSAGLEFLKVGVGGRAVGMGEAYTSMAADPSATYYNPAALSLTENAQLMLMHKEWIQGVKTEFISGTTAFDRLRLGIGLNETSIDDIEVRTVPGPPLETFTARNAAIGLSASYQLDPAWSVGVTGKFLYEKIYAYDASGYGIDFGTVYTTPWKIRLGAAVANLGSMNALEYQASTMPTTIRGGASYATPVESLDGMLTLSSDVVSFTAEGTTHLHLGGELEFSHAFSLRAGYQTGYDAKNFSAGAGVRYGLLQFDYAFVPFKEELGSTHTISLGIQFE